MTWYNSVIDGGSAVEDNKPRLNANSAYIQTTMRKDYYWDEDANKDGHSRKIGMDDIANTGVTLSGSNPANLDAGTVGMYYTRLKNSTEASDSVNQMANAYLLARNTSDTTSHYKQMGFSAAVTFRVSGSSIVSNGGNNWDYQHNVSSVSRSSKGVYVITFATAMPNANYMVFATAESDSTGNSGVRIAQVQNGGKAAGSVTIKVQSRTSSTKEDPPSLSVMVIGA